MDRQPDSANDSYGLRMDEQDVLLPVTGTLNEEIQQPSSDEIPAIFQQLVASPQSFHSNEQLMGALQPQPEDSNERFMNSVLAQSVDSDESLRRMVQPQSVDPNEQFMGTLQSQYVDSSEQFFGTLQSHSAGPNEQLMGTFPSQFENPSDLFTGTFQPQSADPTNMFMGTLPSQYADANYMSMETLPSYPNNMFEGTLPSQLPDPNNMLTGTLPSQLLDPNYMFMGTLPSQSSDPNNMVMGTLPSQSLDPYNMAMGTLQSQSTDPNNPFMWGIQPQMAGQLAEPSNAGTWHGSAQNSVLPSPQHANPPSSHDQSLDLHIGNPSSMQKPVSKTAEQVTHPDDAKKAPKLPSTTKLPQTDPQKPWIRINATTQGKTKRSAMINNFVPEEVYPPLAATPAPWEHFTYTQHGELQKGRTYSASQILDYLYRHPLNVTEADGTKRLRIWIQRFPSDSARRYPHATSSRCRFEECSAKANQNRILPGHFRVCFDEQSWKGQNHDPYINAGYVHLFCMEKLLDFPQVIRDLNVMPEQRALPNDLGGINRMSLGTGRVFLTACKFIESCRKGRSVQYMQEIQKRLERRGLELNYDGTLTQLLHVFKFLDEGSNKERKDFVAGDFSVIQQHHLGNLTQRNRKRADKVRPTKRKPGPSRKRVVVELSDVDVDEIGTDDKPEESAAAGAAAATLIRMQSTRTQPPRKVKKTNSGDRRPVEESLTDE